MNRPIPKQAVDDSTEDYIFSNTRNIEAGSVGTTLMKEFFTGEVEYRRSREFLEKAVTPDHNTGYEPGFLFIRTPGAPRITEFPRIAGTVEPDVDITRLEQHYVKTGMYPAYEIPADGGATWIVDPNFLWDNPGVWHETQIPATARWNTTWTEFPQGGIDLVCAGPKVGRWNWGRVAASLEPGGSIDIAKRSAGTNYVVSIYADIFVDKFLIPKGKLIRLSSAAVTLTTKEPTVLIHAFKKD